jgi:capsular exopolysaccharide synthesis family protein
MSRIHEALKKAEQERAVSQAGQVNLPPTRESWPEATPVVEAPPVNGSPRVQQAPPVSVGAFTDELLLSRSTQRQWKPDPKTMLFFSAEENPRWTEQFRTLRSRFYSMRERMALRTILVASALPKEGKSFVAANLAQVLARQQGRRVLLIDGDMRVPSLHSAFGTTSSPGLAEYLLGEADEFSVMQRGALENLFFVPSGRSVEHPAELVNNGRLGVLLERVGHLFEWVIVDSPPAVPVSDASQLSKYCDGVLLVVRSNSTPYDTAQRAQREFQGKVLVGAVLNGTMPDGAYARYAYETYEKAVQQKT